MLLNDHKPRKIHGISEVEEQRILDYLKGSVYCWCNNKRNDWFAAHDLVGGCNKDWSDTPLIVLYNKQISLGKNHGEAIDQAGIELGWLLKQVLHIDNRTFEFRIGRVKSYRWRS